MEFIKSFLYDTISIAGKRHIAAVLSILTVLGAWASFVVIGPNWGIDFTGGTEIHLQFDEAIEIGEIWGTLRGLGSRMMPSRRSAATLQTSLRFESKTRLGADEMRQTVETKLRKPWRRLDQWHT